MEDIAYRDTWGRGADSFVSMIYERLNLVVGLIMIKPIITFTVIGA